MDSREELNYMTLCELIIRLQRYKPILLKSIFPGKDTILIRIHNYLSIFPL